MITTPDHNPRVFPRWTEAGPTRVLTYFRSGWAFLVPYLTTYLLYAWLELPVNPGSQGDFPCLLHAYWGLHVAHLMVALVAFRSWCRRPTDGQSDVVGDSISLARLCAMLPWFCLLLLIWIPGPYLEFPSDPTAHLGRILVWADADRVAVEGGRWLKASYFLAYSITSLSFSGNYETQLRLYYTGACLLLSWQHYRLAKAMHLTEPSAFFFACLQLLVFGNSVFSYHRYYGLSSTIISQIAAVAALRIMLQHLDGPAAMRSLRHTVPAVGCLVLLMVFNHVQGVLITAIGIVALGLWWLSRHGGRITLVVFALLIAGSIAVGLKALLSPSESLQSLQQAGWLNSIGGFNVFTSSSPAQQRVLQLIGVSGTGMALMGLLMFRRNHVGAWLLTVPWGFLVLPLTAYPLAHYLHHGAPAFMSSFHGRGMEHLSVFSRQLFALPLALPFAWLFSEALLRPRWTKLAPLIPLATIGILLALPPLHASHARFWQALAHTPVDLNLRVIHEAAGPIRAMTQPGGEKKIIGGYGISHVLGELGARAVPLSRRLILYPGIAAPSHNQETLQRYLAGYGPIREFLVVLPNHGIFFSPTSQAAFLSSHWLTQEAALNTVGSPELEAAARATGFRERRLDPQLILLTNFPP